MKLVASSASSKLPAAETCAINDGEDEDYDYDLDDDDDDDDNYRQDSAATKVRKGVRFFHKVRVSSGPSSHDAKVRHRCCFQVAWKYNG